MKQEDAIDGREVIYYPSPTIACHGFIDGSPWRLASGVWVVRLRDMDPSYAAKTGKLGGRNWVNAAVLDHIEYANRRRR